MGAAAKINLYQAVDRMKEIASHKVFFTDTSTGRARNCWQCLIVEFNGRKVTF